MSDIVDRMLADAEYHKQVAGDCDCRPEDTVNWEHATNCLDAAEEIKSLRAQVTIAKNSNGFTVLAEDKARRLEEENRKLRAEVSRSSYHCD